KANFDLPVAGGENPIYRERVYCYELYHRLRLALPADFPYALNGEIDKRAHPLLRLVIGNLKPDFVVHVPGGMDRNLSVLEVKSSTCALDEFREDLEHLTLFLTKAQYFSAIALVFGQCSERREEQFAALFDAAFGDIGERYVLLLRHEEAGKPARVVRRVPQLPA